MRCVLSRSVAALGAAFALAVASAPAVAAPQSATGRLDVVHVDDFAHGDGRYRFAVDAGIASVPLRVDAADADAMADLGGSQVRVQGTPAANGKLAVDPTAGGVQVLSAPLPSPGTGARSVAVLLVTFSDSTGPAPFSAGYARSVVFDGAGSVAAFYAEQSFGKLSLSGDVYGWYPLTDPSTTCDPDLWATHARAAAQARGIDLSNYQHLVYAFPQTSACSWAGLGEAPGSETWVNGAGSFSLRVIGHELGHNFGLHHASSYRCTDAAGRNVAISSTCTSSEYGDPFDVMGLGFRGEAAALHTNAWHKGQAGWLAPGDVQTVASSGTYTVAPLEHGSGVLALQVPRGATGQSYWVDFRQPFGFEAYAPTESVVNGVLLHLDPPWTTFTRSQLIDTNPSTITFTDAALTAGRTFCDGLAGVAIATRAVTPFGASVVVTIGPGGTSPDGAAPCPASDLAAQAGVGSVQLAWTAASDNVGVTGYRVTRDGALLASTAATSLADTPAPGRHEYAVAAYDAAGGTSPAVTVTVDVPAPVVPPAPPAPDPVSTAPPPASTAPPAAAAAAPPARQTPPARPAGLRAVAARTRGVRLRWAAVSGAGPLVYRVYREGRLVGATRATTFLDRAGRRGDRYRVQAVSATGTAGGAARAAARRAST